MAKQPAKPAQRAAAKPAPRAAEPARRPPPPPPRQAAQPPRQAPAQPQRQAAPPPRQAAPPPRGDQRQALAATSVSAQLPAHLRERALRSQGRGISQDAADNLVPIIYILQEQSPQVQSRDSKYVEGALAGNFWLRGTTELFDGEKDGMLVQPCHFNKCVIEWGPDRGQFIARHDVMPEVAEQVEDPNDPNIKRWVNPETGNRYAETREHVVRIFMPDGRRIPLVIPFTSTGHTVSRGWTFDMNQKQVEGVRADSTMLLYRMFTKWTTNKKGSWFKPDVKFEGWVQDLADIDAGDAIFNAFNSGEKRVDEAGYGEMGGEQFADQPGGEDGQVAEGEGRGI